MAISTDSIPARLILHAQARPDETFCTFVEQGVHEHISFENLLMRSASYAQLYQERGINQGDVVVIILQHTPHLFYSYLGAMLVGAIPTFMPFPTSKQRADIYWHDHRILFQKIEPALVVTYQANYDSAQTYLKDQTAKFLVADNPILKRSSELFAASVKTDHLACLQHSSGTTGLKKGVMLTHAAIIDQIEAYVSAIDLSSRDVIASWLPFYHDMGFIACFLTAVVTGARLIAIDPFEWVMRPSLLLDAIQEYQATFTWLPNFAFSHLVNASRKSSTWDLSSMRAFINCSEPCKARTFDRFLERFSNCGVSREKLQVCYAMAENVFAVTQTQMDHDVKVFPAATSDLGRGHTREARPNESKMSVLSCGVPLDGVELRIVGAAGDVLESGRVGEIALRSPFMFNGYYRLPEKTAERLRDGWYYTGDMGFMSDGELFVTGRKDDMLIVNGRNYYAHELERIASEVTGVLPGRNIAIGLEEALTDSTVVVLLVECADGVDAAAVAQGVRKGVLESTGLALRDVIPLRKGELVKTTSGKISRTKNKELYEAGGFTRHEGA